MPRLSKIGAAALAAFGWTGLSSVTASYLQVAGGGGGGGYFGGGGGAGGLLTGTVSLDPTQSYTVVVGAGGSGGAATGTVGTNGSSSQFGILTASVGGGGGGSSFIGSSSNIATGQNGGSGGGAGLLDPGTPSGGTGTSGQGNAGGSSTTYGGTANYGCSGGGGASAVGANGNGSTSTGGAGGAGTASSITGSSVTYAGGGGGSGSVTGGSGGAGGGGTGGINAGVQGTAGTANLGGGGGGSGQSSGVRVGNQGGSGVVIISYVGAQQFGGGVVTSSGGNTIHTFTTSGTLSPLSLLTANFLVVAGGGGGGAYNGGGGGAGGLRSSVTNTGGGGSLESTLTIDTNSIYTVTVGAGGSGQISSTQSVAGSNSSFLSIASIGGGKGGGYTGSFYSASTGGSGGGAPYAAGGPGAAGTANQGFAGGNGDGSTNSGGGGGAGAVGGNATASVGGNGGVGVAVAISGTSTFYAGGGGGAGFPGGGGSAGSGGNGGGGNGGANSAGTSGTANTGGGGGGSQDANNPPNNAGGNGGSGIVIISYPGTTQLMAGGTVTVAGGNVIHTFTSSGYLTPIVLATNSLRFRESASAYLNRTPTVASNQKTFTISFWSKLGQLGTYRSFFSAGTANPPFVDISLQNTDEFQVDMSVSAGRVSPKTTAVFRDPSAWYHFVVAFDTTQATQADRVKVYVNGVQQTITATGVAQNTDLAVNSVVAHNIGRRAVASDSYLDGYMTDINFVDGQALTPNSFGTSNGLGVWQPIRYGGSYGTNGFYLPMTVSSSTISVNYLVVAGGGGGGGDSVGSGPSVGRGDGGGGAGGLRSTVTATGGGGSLESALSLSATSAYTITVGAGGAGGTSSSPFSGTNGSNSVFSSITSIGGGYGSGGANGNSGGSGGGGAGDNGGSFLTGGSGTANQGYAGGDGFYASGLPNDGSGGGGGGAGSVGSNGTGSGTNTGGAGGSGVAVSISGSSVTYAGGGGGGRGGTATGGGGAGNNAGNGTAGTSNTGGGGGGAGGSTSQGAVLGGAGGSGVVIVSYAGAQKFVGGNVVNAGGNTIHTFTTSGTLTPIGLDYSPQGNNWTPNNISLTAGSTYDSMTDVPTLTNATTANYAVFNPINKSTVGTATASGGNLNIFLDRSSDNPWMQTTFALPNSGKWYFEFVQTAADTTSVAWIQVGVMDITTPQQTSVTSVTGQRAYRMGNGFKVTGITSASYGDAFALNDILGVAIDMDSGKMWFAKNNTWQVSGDPVAGTNATFTDLSGTTWSVYAGLAGQTTANGSINFGQRPFSYTPPSGFVALNTFNLPTPTIGATASTTANEYFDVSLYTGNSGTQSITNSGSMQPDFVWLKSRSNALDHGLFDSVRGVQNVLASNGTGAANYGGTGELTAFNSNGFTLVNSGSYQTNQSGYTYVAWQWRASNATAVTNTSGSITSTVSANTTAGFSIATFTGNGTSGATVGHGLGVAPSMVIVKKRSGVADWPVQHISLGPNASLRLNGTDATANEPWWNSTAPSSTVFTLGNSNTINQSGETFVAYCFAQVAGYSAFGSYTGNGSTDGPFIFTGFRPEFILIKLTSSGGESWTINDAVRNTYNVSDSILYPNLSDAEGVGAGAYIDFLSNGFKIRNNNPRNNSSSATYIYYAVAQSPFKYANAR